MSQNVDLVKAGLELYEREGAEALLPIADPEIELHTASPLVNAGTLRGSDELLPWSEQWLDAWEEFHMEPLEFIEVGDSIVVVPLRQTAIGKGSGIEVEANITYLVQVLDGKVKRLHLYPEREQALEAAERLAAGG
jgi:ketosteroid isomerase-like protein